MGHAKFECALYVTCRGDKQKKELTKRFEEEHPGNGRLFMWDSHKFPNRIDFALSSGEFASYLDDDILAVGGRVKWPENRRVKWPENGLSI